MAIYYSCMVPDSGRLLLVVPQLSGTAPSGAFDQLLPVTFVSSLAPQWSMVSASFTSTVADWAFVQQAATPGSSAVASQQVTLPGATSAGRLVVLSAATNAAGLTITDSAGNTWTPIAADTGGLYTFYSVITNAGTLTITATVSGAAAFTHLSTEEFSTSGTIALATPQTAVGSSRIASTAAVSFSGHALDLVFIKEATDGDTPTVSPGYTLGYSAVYTENLFWGHRVLYQLNDSTGSATPSLTYFTVPTVYKNGTPEPIGPVTWDSGDTLTIGGPGTTFAFLFTNGPVLPSDVITVDIPANYVNGSPPAYTGIQVTNATGMGMEPPFGAGAISGAAGCPGLNAAHTTKFGVDVGSPVIDPILPNYLLWNQVYRANNWQPADGNSTGMTYDRHVNLISWPASKTIILPCFNVSAGAFGINHKGMPSMPGKWTLVIDDYGTSPSTITLVESTGNVTLTFIAGESSVVGTTHTLVYDVQYTSSNPTSWAFDLRISIVSPVNNTSGSSDGLAHWAFGTLATADAPWLSPPNMMDGSALAVDRSNPFAINPNVRRQLSAGGKTIEHIREMQAFGGGTPVNLIYACDITTLDGFWPHGRIIGPVTANHVRYANTDPAQCTPAHGGTGPYDWPASTRVYGPQADFVFSDGVTTALTVTLTSGSNAIAITSGTPLLAGGLIVGTGIPANTRLASFSSADGTGWLEYPATASGSQSVTLHNPGYLNIAPGDNGAFLIDGFGAENSSVCEMRFDTPHGMTTGYFPGAGFSPHNTTNGNAVTVTHFGSQDPTIVQGSLYVTGPYTIMCSFFSGIGASSGPQTIVQTTEYDFTATGGWSFNVGVPNSLIMTMAYEAHVAMTADLGCHACWLTMPPWGTDELYASIARAAHQYGNSSLVYRLEIDDEPWNGGNPYVNNLIARLARQNLYGYQPQGTVITDYYTSTGLSLPFGVFAMAQNVLQTGHVGNVFKAALTAAGGSNSVELICGTQYNVSFFTQAIAGSMQIWDVPIDWVVVGPYIKLSNSASIVAACEQTKGNWPLAAINDFTRIYNVFNYSNQVAYFGHQQYIQVWGQPPGPDSVRDAGSHGGTFSSSSGGFAFAHTFVDSAGNETTAGQSKTVAVITAGNSPGFTVPPCPSWVVSINAYVGSGGAQLLDLNLYQNIPIAGNPPGTEIIFNATFTGTGPHPPATNSVPSGTTGTGPKLAGYEGGQAQPIPVQVAEIYFGLQEWIGLTHDVLTHPSAVLEIPTWMMSEQIGCQWLLDSGLTYSTYFGGWSAPCPGNPSLGIFEEFIIYAGTSQIPGPGATNKYALRGSPADGQDHNGGVPLSTGFNGVDVANQTPRGQGILDWLTGAAPGPTVAVTTPASAATGVSVSAPILVTYSEAMDSSTLTLTLNAASIPFTSYNSGTFTATFTPASALANSTTYAAVAGGSSSGGTAMASPYGWSFTTASATTPTVTATNPASGASGVSVSAPVSVTYSEAMNSATLTLTLNAASVPRTSYNSGTFTAVFTPASSLSPSTTYAAVAGGSSSGGTAIASPHGWSFTTASASSTPGVLAVRKRWFPGLRG
jgi:hypothetical protein